MDGPSASSGFNVALNISGRKRAAIGLQLNERNLVRDTNIKINGALAVMLSFTTNHTAFRRVGGRNA